MIPLIQVPTTVIKIHRLREEQRLPGAGEGEGGECSGLNGTVSAWKDEKGLEIDGGVCGTTT